MSNAFERMMEKTFEHNASMYQISSQRQERLYADLEEMTVYMVICPKDSAFVSYEDMYDMAFSEVEGLFEVPDNIDKEEFVNEILDHNGRLLFFHNLPEMFAYYTHNDPDFMGDCCRDGLNEKELEKKLDEYLEGYVFQFNKRYYAVCLNDEVRDALFGKEKNE